MATSSNEWQNENRQEEESSSSMVPITDVIFMTLHHWPWILASIVICVGLAYFYLLRTPKVYTHTADLLVKDDDKKGKSVSQMDFSELGLFANNTNIQNEVTNLSAKDLMEEVVKRLNLDVQYFHDGTFHNNVVYGYDLPLKVNIDGFPAERSYSFKLDMDKNGDISISDLATMYQNDKQKYDGTFKGKINGTIKTPIGDLAVIATPDYQKGEEVELLVQKHPVSATTKSFHKRLKVALGNDKGTVISISFADQSELRADEVLSTLINIYNENWIRDKNQIAVSTSNFINDRLGVIENELGHVDSDISSYKSATMTPDLEAAATMYMTQSQQNQAQIMEVSNQLSMAKYIRSYITSEANREQLIPANTGIQNTDIQSLISEYNNKLLQRNALVAKSSDQNPLVGQLDEQLTAQRQAIVRTIDNEIVGINTQLRSLQGSQARTMSQIASNPTQAKNLLSVERQQKVKESLYLFLLQKREENELTQAFTPYNTRVINRPGASDVPATPKSMTILSLAFLVGLLIPFGVTYLKETLNTTVRGRKDVENLTLPFLGEIPLYGGNQKRDKLGQKVEEKAIVVKGGKRDVINEAFRVMRTNLEFMKLHKDEADVVAITSFNPGSGKSFLAMNLGCTLALKKKRVLIIDGDMRHGSTSAYIGSPKPGLADYLNGNISNIKDAIMPSKNFANLDIIPVGTTPPNPTELLETDTFGNLIADLRTKYDYIIIDCPPIEVVADAQIIDKVADRTVFVVRAGKLERSMLPQLEKLFAQKKYKNMAFILNGTRNDEGRYGYSHAYRYGYGYGYAYGQEYETKD